MGHPALSPGARAEVLGEGEVPGADRCPAGVGGGSLAAGHPALAWPDRWAESWAAVGAVVEALVWWVGTSQAVICPPLGRASGSSPCSPWREPPTEVASESQRSWVKAHSSWLCGQVWGLVAGECSAAPSRLSQGRGGVPLGQGRKGEAPSPLEVRTENWASEQLVLCWESGRKPEWLGER